MTDAYRSKGNLKLIPAYANLVEKPIQRIIFCLLETEKHRGHFRKSSKINPVNEMALNHRHKTPQLPFHFLNVNPSPSPPPEANFLLFKRTLLCRRYEAVIQRQMDLVRNSNQ